MHYTGKTTMLLRQIYYYALSDVGSAFSFMKWSRLRIPPNK